MCSGATGLVGTRLVEKLTQQGATVKVLSRNPEKSRGKLRYSGVEFYDPSQWQDAMRGTKGVINLAGTDLTHVAPCSASATLLALLPHLQLMDPAVSISLHGSFSIPHQAVEAHTCLKRALRLRHVWLNGMIAVCFITLCAFISYAP